VVHTPPRQGSAVQQVASKASTSFWSALLDFAWHDRPVPGKGWDEVGPDHPFLSVRIQVRIPCAAQVAPVPSGSASSMSIDEVLLTKFAWKALFSTHLRATERASLCLASLCLLLVVAWLSCLPCRNWWNVIIIIVRFASCCARASNRSIFAHPACGPHTSDVLRRVGCDPDSGCGSLCSGVGLCGCARRFITCCFADNGCSRS
jgi:hypothetical protein